MIEVLLGIGALMVFAVMSTSKKVAAGPTLEGHADGSGLVQVDPFGLASQAGVDINTYALARMVASEASDKLTKVACAWACLNYATRRAKSVSVLLLAGKGLADGRFGAQNLGKYASTKNPPGAGDLSIAADVLAKRVPDPTSGAEQWDNPVALDALKGKKIAGYTKSADEVAAERSKSHDLVMVPGVSPTRFWRLRLPAAAGRRS